MTNPIQSDPDRLRLALDNGEEVELDGGTLVVDGEESPSMVLRLAPWRARSVARVLEEWSAVSWVLHRATRPILTELELSRTLDLAASALGNPESIMPMQRGGQTVPSRQRLDAVAVLAQRESRLSALQRLALVDAATSWLSKPNGGDQLAHALLSAACTTEVTAEHAYLALITPSANSNPEKRKSSPTVIPSSPTLLTSQRVIHAVVGFQKSAYTT
jgi:hypothetical protein